MLRRVKTLPLKIISLSVLLLVFLVGILALAVNAPKASRVALRKASTAFERAFTLTTSRTVTDANARTRLVSTQQRFQRSDGTYKLVQTFYSQDSEKEQVQTIFGYIGLGAFRLDEAQKRLVFTGPQKDDRPTDVESFLRSHAQIAITQPRSSIRQRGA